MTCFVLAGKVIELEPIHVEVFTETKKLMNSISAGPKSSQSGDGRGSFINHYFRSVVYPTQRFLEKPGAVLNPKAFGSFGVKTYLELIGKHYEYFIQGKDPWD